MSERLTLTGKAMVLCLQKDKKMAFLNRPCCLNQVVMNFLAHFLLSSASPSLMVGNFLGDFVKGKQYTAFPEDIARGIRLHREIDAYTDTHPVFLQSKHRLVPAYGHYAGVVVDMFYDHLLAVDWNRYETRSLPVFAGYVYEQLEAYRYLLPEKAAYALSYMANHNWLLSYARVEGIQRALEGMARRTQFASGMEHATKSLKKEYVAFEEEFHSFFPQIMRHVALFLTANP